MRRLFSLLALLGAGAALAVSGHASAAEPQFLTRPAVFAHVVAVAFWIGGLVPLAVAMGLPPRRPAELTRFSRAIPIAVVVMVATGIMLAVIQVRRLDAFWTTNYGLVLLAKVGAVAVLFALAAVNRYALTPRVLRGNGTAARRLAGSGRQISVTVLDGQFGPLAAKEVTLVLAQPAAGIETLRLAAKHVDGATWRLDGVSIPVPGRWTVRVEILVSDFEKVVIEDHIDLPR